MPTYRQSLVKSRLSSTLQRKMTKMTPTFGERTRATTPFQEMCSTQSRFPRRKPNTPNFTIVWKVSTRKSIPISKFSMTRYRLIKKGIWCSSSRKSKSNSWKKRWDFRWSLKIWRLRKESWNDSKAQQMAKTLSFLPIWTNWHLKPLLFKVSGLLIGKTITVFLTQNLGRENKITLQVQKVSGLLNVKAQKNIWVLEDLVELSRNCLWKSKWHKSKGKTIT